MGGLTRAAVFVHKGRFELFAPYDASFIEDFKILVPWRERNWDPDRKVWFVETRWLFEVLDLMDTFFSWVMFNMDDQTLTGHTVKQRAQYTPPKPPPGPSVPEPYRILMVAPTAPPEVIKAAYRALCQMRHPDRGGTHEEMVTLNRAFEEISQKW